MKLLTTKDQATASVLLQNIKIRLKQIKSYTLEDDKLINLRLEEIDSKIESLYSLLDL
jgi:hypothetical protein